MKNSGDKHSEYTFSSRDEPVRLHEYAADFWLAGRAVLPGTLFFAVIIVVATLGYMALGWQAFDAFYMVVITVFSVGYGETQPVDTLAERLWTILVIFSGWSAVVVTLGSITKAVTEGEFRRAADTLRKTRVMEHLHDHVIICGYGRMGQTLAHELYKAGLAFVVIDRDEERIAQISTEGFLSHRGDATDEDVLEYTGIRRAKALATVLPQDALNVYITLTARNLSQSIRIIARGEQASTEKKLIQAGANEVVLPATIGAMRIAHSLIEPEIGAMLREATGGPDLRASGIKVEELLLHDHAHLLGKSIADVQRLGRGELMVLGLRRNHKVLRDDLNALLLCEGDSLIVLSRSSHLPSIIRHDVERTELL